MVDPAFLSLSGLPGVEPDELLRLVVESVRDDAVCALDPEGRVRTWNTGAERLAGWGAEEIVGQSVAHFYPPEDVQAGKPERLLREAAERGRVEDQGWRVRKDGSRFFARVILTALHDRDGRLVGYGKVTSDVTEAMSEAERDLRAERALREGHELFRLLVESVRDYAIFVLDTDGRVATWNAGAARLKGWTTAEVLGQHFSRFYPPEDVAAGKPESELERAARDGRVEDQGWRLRKDGSKFFARVVITALRDATGRLRGYAKVTNDVTESRLAWERVLEVVHEASRLLETPESTPRLEAVARLAVPQLADWCVVDLLEGGELRRVAAVHADPRQDDAMRALAGLPSDLWVELAVRQVLERGEPLVVTHALQPGGPDGFERELLARLGLRSYASLPLVARGRTMGAITFCARIAARYHQEDLLWLTAFARTASSALEGSLLLEEAEEAARVARKAVAVRDEFLSIASHELRTPLNTLGLLLQGMRRAALRNSDAATVERLDRGRAALEQLEALIRTMLDISRIAAGRLILEPVELDLCALVRSVVHRDEEAIAAAGCELRLELPGPTVGRWDRLRLDQVLTNLLSNALKFGAGRPVRIAVEAEGERVRLVVEDRGIGVPREDLGRIFERYERAVSPRAYGGLGLGLWIVREIVRSHRGEVRVESEPGAGARFTVELPREPEREADQARPQ